MKNTYSIPSNQTKSYQLEKRRRYYTYLKRLENRLKDGTFWRYSKRKQRSLIKRLKRLWQQLSQWGIPIGKLAATSALLSLLNLGTTQAQTLSFTEKIGIDNPLDTAFAGYWITPSFADIDGDGDLDAFVGEFNSNTYTNQINYFKNEGTAQQADFVIQPAANNPFTSHSFTYFSFPEFVDIDADGDLDAFVGGVNNPYAAANSIRFFENTGTVNAPIFTEQVGANNPLVAPGNEILGLVRLADLDNDGDYDAAAVTYSETTYLTSVRYFENIGTDSVANFVEQTGVNSPFVTIFPAQFMFPDLVDIDNDGDLDFIAGNYDALYSGVGDAVLYYENIGTDTAGIFVQQTVPPNPFAGTTVFAYGPVLAFADIDADGDQDYFQGDYDINNDLGILRYFENGLAVPNTSLDSGVVVLNEFLSVNLGENTDQDGEYDPWIELYNTTTDSIDLGNAYLSDDLGNPTKWALPDTNLMAGEFLLIWADGDSMQAGIHAPELLNSQGGLLMLSNSDSSLVDSVHYDGQLADISTGRLPNGIGSYTFMPPTPSDTNIMFPLQAGQLVINEFMADNEQEVVDQDGEYEDWIEVHNPTTDTISLNDVFLSNDAAAPHKWMLPDTAMMPGEYLVVWADEDTTQSGLHTNFVLQKNVGQIRISYPNGQVLDSTSYGPQVTDISTARIPNATGPFALAPSSFAMVNSPFSLAPSELVINEFMADNQMTQADQDGEFDDWIELFNPTERELSLRGVFVSNNALLPNSWKLPDTTLAPNDYLILWADNEPQSGLHTNFELDHTQSGEILLSYPNGVRLDSVMYGPQNTDESTGRYPNGTGPFGFMPPTYSDENTFFTSVEGELGSIGIELYPNPARDHITVVLSEPLQIPLSLVNLQGQEVGNWNIHFENQISINVSDFPSGMYVLRIGNHLNHRLIIKR
ncbi:MAG: lamin tail domain-containing protein [Bacteroidota bacterium]